MLRWVFAAALMLAAVGVYLMMTYHAPSTVASINDAVPSPTDTPVDEMCSDDAANWNHVPRSMTITNNVGSSSQTKLFDDPTDKCAQIHAVDDDEEDTDVPSREMDAMGAVTGRPRGYILPIGNDAIIEHVGHRWAQVFAKFHPHNHHCALVIVETESSEDLTKNDDYGYGIADSRCYR